MKDLKFRAWIPKDNFMFYQGDQYLCSFIRRANQLQFGGSGHESYGMVELMMWTGFKDNNGKQIFEGDIIKFRFNDKLPYNIEECPKIDVGYYHWYQEMEDADVEVIGNIYENPELIK